jgi:Rps23 Pro-64 3,4-dihydroxylase Tpa1-like proline 4-hydroxylase
VPYTIIDNFLPADIFDAVVNDIDNISNYTVFSNDTSYRKECRNFVEAPILQTLSNGLQSSNVVKWLEAITGIEKLIPDPHLRGGGLSRVSSGNKLGLHTDFNWNDQIQLNRKVNLILYLTPNWQSEWDGDLEFWNFENTECLVKIKPKANRLAIWNYDPRLVHGLSNTLSMPTDIYRDNLIHFYYTSNATWEVDPKRSQFY